MDYFVENDPTTICSPGGFWEHSGVLVKGFPKYMWFPITAYTKRMIEGNSTEVYKAVPCMDNSLLLLNQEAVEELVLLDEGCDTPADVDWDSDVNCGDVPAVMYEAFDGYMCFKAQGGELSQYGLSKILVAAMDEVVSAHKIEPDDLHTAAVLFSSGRMQRHGLCDEESMELVTAVRRIMSLGN